MKKPYSILVVDDVVGSRDVLWQMLEEQGYSVSSAQDGKEALEMSVKTTFDLFLIDVAMPMFGGIALLKELNVFENTYEAIMMTGNESLEDVKQAMELGAFNYICKPLRREELLHQVEKALHLVEVKKQRMYRFEQLEKKVKSRSDDLAAMVKLLEYQGGQLDAVINSMGEGLFAFDNQQSLVLMNRQAEEILDIRFAQCAGTDVRAALGVSPLAQQLLNIIDKDELVDTQENKVSVAKKGAGIKYYQVNIHKILDEKGKFMGNVVILLDQTAVVNSEHLRSSFLSVVAHELRTPVTVIMNYLEILSDTEKSEPFSDMKIVCARLARIVETLITGMRLSNGAVSANSCVTHVVNLVEKSIEKFRNELVEKKIIPTIENRLRSPVIATDAQLLGIALEGLIDNAIKFNKECGYLKISLEVRLVNSAPFIAISVCDQGLGISDMSKKNLFENFTQGENHLTRHFSGLGVGLFMVNRAMELLGGNITVESVDGEGSCFIIEIPFVDIMGKENV